MTEDNTGRNIVPGVIAGAILWVLLAWAAYGIWSYFHPCCCKCDATAYSTKIPLYKEKI